jgi:hypothetical protein
MPYAHIQFVGSNSSRRGEVGVRALSLLALRLPR